MSKESHQDNSAPDFSAVVSEHLANAKKLRYADMKGGIKENFEKFMKNPNEYGVTDSELAAEIQKMGGLSKYFMWKQFKSAVKLKMIELAANEAAHAFMIDFEQDENHQLKSVAQLEKMLANPSHEKYALEADMIAYIQSDRFDKKKFVEQVIKLDNDLEQDVSAEEGFGDKLLNFLTGIWEQIAPVINKIMDTLVDFGAVVLKNSLDKYVPESLKDEVDELIDAGADGLKELDEVVTTVVETHEDGGDISKAATDYLKEIGQEVVGDAQEIIESSVRDAMGSSIGGVISAIAAPAFPETDVTALGEPSAEGA